MPPEVLEVNRRNFRDWVDNKVDPASVNMSFLQLGDLPGRGAGKYANIPVDIWGCGMILMYVLTGQCMFSETIYDGFDELLALHEADPDAPIFPPPLDSPIFAAVVAQNHEGFWAGVQNDSNRPLTVSDEAKDLLNLILNPDPEKRPNLGSIPLHPWLSSEAAEDQRRLQLYLQRSFSLAPEICSVDTATTPLLAHQHILRKPSDCPCCTVL
jgi:serine/threonine protein kinase